MYLPKRHVAIILVALGLITTFYSFFDQVHQHIDSLHSKIQGSPEENQKAVLFSLVRNEEIEGILDSINYVQTRFNNEFHYDWIFANDKPFSRSFKKQVNNLFTSGKAIFAEIPEEYWSYPEFIDQEKAAKHREEVKDKYIYGGSESYRFMCRFNSGFFYKLKEFEPYRYYWRVEPDIKFLCNIKEDPFKVMIKNRYTYAWAMTMYEFSETIPSLWSTVKQYIKESDVVKPNSNFMQFISDDDGETYNNCHYWSNFEVADLEFFRSQQYEDFFQYLDKSGGFFYERWGDAPVHTIATSMFLSEDKIHHFPNTGYYHVPNQACPLQASIRDELQCNCRPENDWTFHKHSCTPKYYATRKLPIPQMD